ncbi:hypothetical protein BGZ49_010689 [Haplosporangium sp. Z 27]|nr:hypothetical protein BGZ49_010689 [Haplosporangium sp. Z 27]
MERTEEWEQRQSFSRQRIKPSQLQTQRQNIERTLNSSSTLPAKERLNEEAKGSRSAKSKHSGKTSTYGTKKVIELPPMVNHNHEDLSIGRDWRSENRETRTRRTWNATQRTKRIDDSDFSDKEARHQLPKQKKPNYGPNHQPNYRQYSTKQIIEPPPYPSSPTRQQYERSHRKIIHNATNEHTLHSCSDTNQSRDSTRRSFSEISRYKKRLESESLSEDESEGDDYKPKGNISTTRHASEPSAHTTATHSMDRSERSTHTPDYIVTETAVASNRTAKSINQSDLDQRIQALRASISDLNRSTQKTIASKPAETLRYSDTDISEPTDPHHPIDKYVLESRRRSNTVRKAPLKESHRNSHISGINSSAKRNGGTKRVMNQSDGRRFGRSSDNESSSSDYSSTISHSTSDSIPPYRPRSIHQKTQSIRKGLERSQFESQRLQQWITERSHITPKHTRSTSSETSIERPMRRSELGHNRESRKYLSPHPWSNGNTSVIRNQPLPWKRASQFTTKAYDGIEKRRPYQRDIHRRSLQAASMSKMTHGSLATDSDWSEESEYRDPNKRIHVDLPEDSKCSDALPQTKHNSFLAATHKDVPKTVTHKTRDYVAGQVGFYTFLDDGFGMDTLAYCHDLWEFPNDPRSLQPDIATIFSQTQLFITKAKISISIALDRLLNRVFELFQVYWQRRKEEKDSLDWLYH